MSKSIAKVNIMGVPFSKMNMDDTVAYLTACADAEFHHLHQIITANPEIVMSAAKDPSLMQTAQEAALVTPDGIGIVLAARWKGQPVAERVPGYDMLLQLLAEGDKREWSFYFLGTDEETSRKAVETITAKHPHVRIAGRQHGFFSKEEEPAIVAHINETKPDFLIVALGAPGAERWIARNKAQLQAKIAIGVGGSLDIIAGKTKRAPAIWQKLNLEWLYRLLSQPSRWRRQLVLPIFAMHAYRRRKEP